MEHTTVRSWGAIGLGIVFAGYSLWVMIEDAVRQGNVTSEHLGSAAMLLAAIASGHLLGQTLRAGRVFPAIGLALLFLVGTAYVINMASSRQSYAVHVKLAEAKAANRGRELLEAELKQAKYQLELASAEVLRECKSGVGEKCRNYQGRERAYQALVRERSAEIAKLPPVKPENGPTDGLTSLLELAGIHGQALLSALWPFLPSLGSELGAIVFFSLGFGRASGPRMEILPPARATITDPVIDALREGPMTNDELAAKLGVRKGTASKLVSARMGQLRRERVGREVRISLAAPTMH